MGRTWEDRVAEYVSSPALAFRVKVGKTVACRVYGNYGVYMTTADLGSTRDGSCTCPSDYDPCKHIEALRITYKKRPRSFRDVDTVLRRLGRKSKEELLDIMRHMILSAPTALGALGVKGFDERDLVEPFE